MKDIVGHILDEMILESRQNDQNFVGREKKDQAAFSPLVLTRGSEGVGKTGTERLHRRTCAACPHGEDWSGRVFRLPQGLGRIYPLFELWLNIKKHTLYKRCNL